MHERNSFNKEPKCNRVRATFADERKQFILNGQVAKRLSTRLLTAECDENSSMQVRILSCPLKSLGFKLKAVTEVRLCNIGRKK